MSIATPVMARTALAYPKQALEASTHVEYLPLAGALTQAFAFDAHFTAYSLPEVPRRLSRDIEGTRDVPMVLLVADVDQAETHAAGADAESAWRSGERAKVAALRADHPDVVSFDTRGGYRLIARLAEPFVIRSTDDRDRWVAAYEAWLDELASTYGIVADRACKDWTRLYRLPHVVRDGVGRVSSAVEGNVSEPGAWSLRVPELPAATPARAPKSECATVNVPSSDVPLRTRIQRARAYVATCEPAVSGANGHDDAMRVATAIVRGFSLDESSALEVLDPWNARCAPPWSDADLRHKVEEAARVGDMAWGAKLVAEPSAATAPRPKLPKLGDAVAASIVRAERRASGSERPIALPWPTLAEHFGGGLWPGFHVINKGTGCGGTQLALQVALGATKRSVPALYVGLELGDLDLALRLLGEEAHVPWSSLWTGKAGPEYLRRIREAAPALESLPFHYEVARPMGFPASALLESIEALRATYPEQDGPGSAPLLVVVDFLQLIGDEPQSDQEVRSRIGRASYVLRDAANRLGVAVICISSVARERYKTLADIHGVAGLAYDTDADGCPINRRILDVDAIVGMGKESGEIEFSADSVSVLARVPATWDGRGSDVVFATAKGRATGATWSPLHFTGFRYEECPDRGGRLVEAWNAASEAREHAKEERRSAKEQAKLSAVTADANAVRAYVLAHPGCSVREARMHAAGDSSGRWSAAVAMLGEDLEKRKRGKAVGLFVRTHPSTVDSVDSVDGPRSSTLHGRAPQGPSTVDVDGGGVRGGASTSTVPVHGRGGPDGFVEEAAQ